MFIVTVVVIAVAVIVYFAFYSGKAAGLDEAATEIESPVLDDSVTTASVKNKYIMPGSRNSIVHVVVFDCDDGEEREFALNKEIFDAIGIGQSDTLVYSGAIFLGFGEYGGTEIDGDEVVGIMDADSFSSGDFDASIDIEQSVDLTGGAGEDTLSAEDKEALERFLDYDKLPAKSELITEETDSLSGSKAKNLLQKVTIYPFLKREEKIVRMFESACRDAVDDMLGYDGDSRQGQAADSVFINGNEIRLVVTVKELPPPLRSTVTAELGVND